MRMYHFRCHVVGEGDGFELAADAAWRDGGTEAVEEDGTVGFVEKGKPFEGIGSECLCRLMELMKKFNCETDESAKNVSV